MKSFQPTFGNALQDFFMRKVRAANAKRQERLAALKTREDALIYVNFIREKILGIFNLPQEKNPLNAVMVNSLKGDGFTMEKIIYYSRPCLPVTSCLYIPNKLNGPAPAVLFLCGHSQEGKGSAVYQTACQGLVRQGYVVLIIDPISQGERYQFMNVPNSSSISGHCCQEHNMMGKQLQLVGEYFGSWRAWDAIRGLDYLLERPEVDKNRVGITGNSGGGTMTTFVNALEDRFAMAAPSCYITSWKRNLENELPADVEQIPPGILGMGMEMGDMLIARAPRPLIILGQRNDFFDARGTAETYEDVKHVYRLLGAEDKVKLFVGPVNHGYSRHNREAMYEFFNLQSGLGGQYTESDEFPLFSNDEMNCVPVGQVEYLAGRRMVRDFIHEKADRLAGGCTQKSPEYLKALFTKKLQVGEIKVPYYRVLRPQIYEPDTVQQKVFSRFALEIEPEVPAVMRLLANDTYFHLPAGQKAVLYISHLDTVEELSKMNFNPELLVCGLDVRGIGDTMPLSCDQSSHYFFAQYQFDYHFSSCHLLFGDTYLGAKVRDILGTLALLESAGYSDIHLSGRGMGTIPTALAALIYGKASAVTLFNAPESWDSMLRNAITMWPQSCMLPGILENADLPDVYAAIPNLKIIQKWDNLFNTDSERFDAFWKPDKE